MESFTQFFFTDEATSIALLAAQIDGSPNFSTSVTGNVITITGPATGEEMTGGTATFGVTATYNEVPPNGDATDVDPIPSIVETQPSQAPGAAPNPAPPVTTTPGTPAVVTGAVGADVLTGGGGADTFVISVGGSALTARDTITDFSTSSGDLIDFLDAGLGAGTAANYGEGDGFANFAAAQAAADAAMNGTVLYFFAGSAASGTGWLFADANGDGTADVAVNLTGVTTMAGFDFSDIG